MPLPGPERSADGPLLSALPPRAPIRNTAATASLRTRPPPPPYTSNGRQKPPPYPGRTLGTPSNVSTSQLFLNDFPLNSLAKLVISQGFS